MIHKILNIYYLRLSQESPKETMSQKSLDLKSSQTNLRLVDETQNIVERDLLKQILNQFNELEHFYIDSEQFLYLFELQNTGAISDATIQQELQALVVSKSSQTLTIKQWLSQNREFQSSKREKKACYNMTDLYLVLIYAYMYIQNSYGFAPTAQDYTVSLNISSTSTGNIQAA